MATYTIYYTDDTVNPDTKQPFKRKLAQTDNATVADELLARFGRIYPKVAKIQS